MLLLLSDLAGIHGLFIGGETRITKLGSGFLIYSVIIDLELEDFLPIVALIRGDPMVPSTV